MRSERFNQVGAESTVCKTILQSILRHERGETLHGELGRMRDRIVAAHPTAEMVIMNGGWRGYDRKILVITPTKWTAWLFLLPLWTHFRIKRLIGKSSKLYGTSKYTIKHVFRLPKGRFSVLEKERIELKELPQ